MSNKKKKLLSSYFNASCSTFKRSANGKISKITNIVIENQVVDLAVIFYYGCSFNEVIDELANK